MKPLIFMLGVLLVASLPAMGEIKTDIEYGHPDYQSLKLDANTPDGPGPFPIAILVHGGGWSVGDKAALYHIPTEALTKANFTWFSINYRMAPAYLWPDCYEDTKTAIRWVKAHAAEFKGDPHRIALIGYSAGGHLVCLAATMADDDTHVQAVVGMSPPTDLEFDLVSRGGLSTSLQHLLNRPKEVTEQSRRILHDMSAINHIRPGLPPFLLMEGDKDKSVPFQSTLNFQSKLMANGNSCDFITIKGAPHDIAKWPGFDPNFSQKIVDWLLKKLGPESAGVPGAAAAQ
jgi:acetyl esterase/lipase